MMSAAHVKATVAPGGRIEVFVPEFATGDAVDVFLVGAHQSPQPRHHVADLMASFPPGPRSCKTWDEIERHLQAERDSWER